MNDQLIAQTKKAQNIKYIFCDYYDTVVHRRVHPLQPFKIWARHLKQELEFDITIDQIFKIRRASMRFLSRKTGVAESEISYDVVMQEVYSRLDKLTQISSNVPFSTFVKHSIEADYQSESSIQYINKKTVATIQYLKEQGYTIYCVSDFHSDEALMSRLLRYHGIDRYYDKVFVSAANKASKENRGMLFKVILEKEGIAPGEVLMVGDNPISDVANAKLHGIESHYLKRYWYKIRQKYLFLIFSLENRFS